MSFQTERYGRRFFTKLHEAIPLPNLIEIQRTSYDWFLRDGLKELLEEISPIEDYGRQLGLYFTKHYFDDPRFDETTSKKKNLTYEAAIRVRSKLVNKKTNEAKEQEIYLGDFPLMTKRGTFIINGIERVVVS